MAEVLDLTLSDNDGDSDDEDYDAQSQQSPLPNNKYASTAVSVKNEEHKYHPRLPSTTNKSPVVAPRFNNDPNAPKLTIVNGKGFWKSWTRSFKTTLLKLLDLIDNSVDGITTQNKMGFTGRIHIYPDVYKYEQQSQSKISKSTTNNRTEKKKYYTSTTTGLCIRNNSPVPIVPLSQALVVHNTNKGIDDSGEIGENGVGLKQACAALCDLSFVLVKSGSNCSNNDNANTIELGIVAKSLQREEGPYLPAFQFSYGNEDEHTSSSSSPSSSTCPPLREQMLSLFSQSKHSDVARCIAQYGANISSSSSSSLSREKNTTSNPNQLTAGIDGICKHFNDMCHNFHNNEYVFEVILHKIRHGQSSSIIMKEEDNNNNNNPLATTKRRALDAQQKITVNQLIKELRREIPRTYLHIPDAFEIRVGKERLVFKYWQERLVELSNFTISVGSTIPWKQNFEVSDAHPDAYDLRLFIGFDRHRIADSDIEADTGENKKGNKNASLYFYSRQSGRLIKSEPDARQMLGLTTSTSLYGAALTIIIDDIGGCLPLHPTKQDISFGLENKGAVHEENLFAWVGAVTKFYYKYHFKKCNNLKKVLSAKVSHYIDRKLPKEPKTYDESEFTTFQLVFENYRNTIRVDAKLTKEIIGSDTYFRLLPETGNEASSKGKAKKRSRSNTQKKQPANKSDKQPLVCGAEKAAKRLRPSHLSYREESDDSDGESSIEALNDEERKRCWSKLQKNLPENKFRDKQLMSYAAAKTTAKQSRPRPDSYHEESGPDSDAAVSAESNVKIEASMMTKMNSKCDQDFGCVDLCDSSDDENSYMPPAGKSEESGAHGAPDNDPQTYAGSKMKHTAPQSLMTERNKVKGLEQTIRRLKVESQQKILALETEKIHALENENKELKKQLIQKGKVISVLKRRLGAEGHNMDALF